MILYEFEGVRFVLMPGLILELIIVVIKLEQLLIEIRRDNCTNELQLEVQIGV